MGVRDDFNDDGRTAMGNTPTCEDCEQPEDHCVCGDLIESLKAAEAFIEDELSTRRGSGFSDSDYYLRRPAQILKRIEKSLASTEVAAIIAQANDALPRGHSFVNGFDYKHQAWVANGRYMACGHGKPCNCYGTIHDGQPVAADADVHWEKEVRLCRI